MNPVFVITLGDVVSIVIGIIASVSIAAFFVREWWIQRFCNHDSGVNENQACHAICKGCGKDLGFIGTWREKQGEEQ